MAKVTNGVETLPKMSIARVGCTNVTDRLQTDRRSSRLLKRILVDKICNTNNSTARNLYTKVGSGDFWPARDWSKPPSVNRQRHIRGRRLNDDVVLRRLFTLHYLAPSSLFQPSDTAGKFAIGQRVPSACGLTDNRAVSLDTVTARHLGSDIYDLKQLPIIWAAIRVKGEARVGT